MAFFGLRESSCHLEIEDGISLFRVGVLRVQFRTKVPTTSQLETKVMVLLEAFMYNLRVILI